MAYVMGPDDRVEVTDGQVEMNAIQQTGMIRIEDEEFVSGLLTGENCDVVISAGHAAIYWESMERKGWQKGKIRGRGKFRFNVDPSAGGDWQNMRLVASGYEHADNVGKDEHDWSIFRISSPTLMNCEIISIMHDGLGCRSELLMPGFHFDRPDTKLVDRSCRVKQTVDRRVIVHDCDSKEGSSGSPLFCQDDDKLALLAINISGLTNKDYFDAGVYGKSGLAFDRRQHKNFAISIGGEFYRALIEEMKASAERRLSID